MNNSVPCILIIKYYMLYLSMSVLILSRELSVTYKCNGKLEACGIIIEMNNKELGVIYISTYKPPGMSILAEEWLEFFEQFDCRILVLGDLNAHHISWGNNYSCGEGKKLFEAVVDSDLGVLNEGSWTTIPRNGYRRSAIDLSLVSIELVPFCKWRVIDETWGSDHFPVRIDIFGKVSRGRKAFSSKLYNYRTDWKQVKKDWFKSIPVVKEIISDDGIDPVKKYHSFMSIISEEIAGATLNRGQSRDESSNDNRRGNPVNTPAIWWNDRCERAIRIRKAAFMKYKFKSTFVNFIEYKKAEANSKIILRKEKKEHFLNFCSSLSFSTNEGRVWSKIKCMNKNYHRNEKMYAENVESKSSVLSSIDSLCPYWVPTRPLAVFDLSNKLIVNDSNIAFSNSFSFAEFKAALNGTKNKSSPGSDMIYYYTLKALPIELQKCLILILNELFFQNLYPEECSEFTVFFIPKANSRKYRSISMSQCILKLLERMVFNRLYGWLEKK